MGQWVSASYQCHSQGPSENVEPLEDGGAVWQRRTVSSLVQPHHATLSSVTSGAIPNLSEPDYNISAPSPNLEMVITASAVQFTKRMQTERSHG